MKMLPDGTLQADTPEDVQLLLAAAQPKQKPTPVGPVVPHDTFTNDKVLRGNGVAVLTDVVTVEAESHPLEVEPVVLPEVKRHVTPAEVATREKPREVAYVTQAEEIAIGMMRHHVDPIKTKQAAILLRWSREKATRVITGLERGTRGMPKLVEKVPGTYRYRLTPYGKRAQLAIVVQPARMRGES